MPELRTRLFDAPVLAPAQALLHFSTKLAAETDPGDLREALDAKAPGLVVIDARRAEGFAEGHIPGALHAPYKDISAQSTASWDKSALYVTYCSSVTCNASSKAAAALAGLGFKVKELVGGIQSWKEKGHPVEGGKA